MIVQFQKRKTKGFTIVELLIVIVIIAILAAITIVSFANVSASARDANRAAEVSSIKKALDLYYLDNFSYPPACPTDYVGCSLSNLSTYLVPKYMPRMPTDPSNNSVRWYEYVRGAAVDGAYAVWVPYERKAPCKTGVEVQSGWWGASTPMCA